MPLTVLSVAYPFAPVGPDAVGGAEQVLTQLDAALAKAGAHSIVIACEGSTPAGSLVSVPAAHGVLTDSVRAAIHDQVRQRIEETLVRYPVDLVHLHGVDFMEYLPPRGVPVLVTLHLPPAWYPKEVFNLGRPDTHLQCVSRSQRQACPNSRLIVAEIPNGVPVEALAPAHHARRKFAFALGRICREKGFHLALEAASRACVPMLLAGEVFRYPAHEEYFQKEIVPRLDRHRRFIGPAGFRRKRRLMAGARCLLVPSRVAETSSLVAMEALACGTPVVAFPIGALTEIIDHGRTGFLVSDEREMADAIHAADSLEAEACRQSACERFSLSQMVARYFELYERLTLTPSGMGGRRSLPLDSGHSWRGPSPAFDPTLSSFQAVRPPAMGVREVTEFASLQQLRPEWSQLWSRCPSATPFQSPEWLIPWWKHFGHGQLCSLTWRCGGKLAALLPAFIKPAAGALNSDLARQCADERSGPADSETGAPGLSGRTLLLLGTGITDYMDMLVDPPFQDSLKATLLRDLVHRSKRRWARADFQQLRSSSLLLAQPQDSGGPGTVGRNECCPILKLPSSAEQLSAFVPPHQCENLAYYRRRAARLGQVEFVAAGREDLEESFECFFRLHQARWQARGSGGVLADDTVQAFHREVAQGMLRTGVLRLYLLRINSEPAAALYGFSHRRTFYYYLSGFDPQFAAVSPGTLIVGHAIEAAISEGAEAFDFLCGQEAYKYLWGAQDSPTHRLQLDAPASPR